MKTFLKYFLSPILVGFAVLVGQFFIQPLIAKSSFEKQEIMKLKIQSYCEALDLVNKFFLSNPWSGDSALKYFKPITNTPTSLEINNCYCKMSLVTEDTKLLDAFLDCVSVTSTHCPTTASKERLIKLMREDLWKDAKTLKYEELKTHFPLEKIEK